MSIVEHTAYASPLDMLGQWRNDLPGGPPLRELLILGYTADLAFLERFCVPAARQLGARVTVLGDCAQSAHDAVDVRLAGRAYQHGLAATPGAFHPKVAVLVGDEHLWAAVGSGNPTMSGWGHNHELWWVLRGKTDRGPQAQADLGGWLIDLALQVPMPSWIAATIDHVGRRVVPQDVDGSHAEVRVLHNLRRPLLEQLPQGPTGELRLAAPFFDPSGHAVRAIIDRLRPADLTVGLQEELTSYEGRTLVGASARVPGARFCSVDDRRTMHGKLIEWATRDGAFTALVGSANITGAALLKSTEGGGNCELAVLSPATGSLFPPSQPLSQDDVAAHESRGVDEQGDTPSLHLLGCRRLDDGLSIEFVLRHAVAVTVETSVDGSPGSWQPKAVIPASRVDVAGTTSAHLTAPEVTGGVVRLVAVIGDIRADSAPLFVTDTARCRPRTEVGDAPRLLRDYDTEQVFTDAELAARFDRDLRRLLDLSSQHRAAGPSAAGRADARGVATGDDEDRWHRFLDVVEHTLGTSMTELVFPGALPSAASVEAAGWSVADIGDETELTEGETEDAIETLDEARVRRAIVIPLSERGRYRAWARRWVKAVARRPPSRDGSVSLQPVLPLRMTVASLYLELLAAGVWRNDESWRDEFADLVQALVADFDELDATPVEGRGYLASLVAVCLAVLLHNAELHGGTPADITARRAWEAGHGYAAQAEDALIEATLLTSTQADSRIAVMSDVKKLVALAREAVSDPFAEAKAAFESDGFDVERDDGVWIIRGDFRNTMRIAARGVTDFSTAEGVVTVATNGKRSTVMLRRGATLIMADTTVRQWRTFDVRPPTTPESLFTGGERLPTSRTVSPISQVPSTAQEIANAADVDVAELVRVVNFSCESQCSEMHNDV